MNRLPVETRIDILAIAVSRLVDVLEAFAPANHPGIRRALEEVRADAERCMED